MTSSVCTRRAFGPAGQPCQAIPVPNPGPCELLMQVPATAVTAAELTWPAIGCSGERQRSRRVDDRPGLGADDAGRARLLAGNDVAHRWIDTAAVVCWCDRGASGAAWHYGQH